MKSRTNVNIKVRKLRLSIVAILTSFGLSNAFADLTGLSAIPSNWRLQDYVGGAIYLYYTGSSCTSGLLFLSAPTEAERNRLWALILAAKLSNRAVFVYYDSANCAISSFGMDG